MCGIFGIYAPGHDVAQLTYFALLAMQHRGQESAGIAVSDGEQIRSHVGMGLVNQVFTEEILASLKGHIAIGHVRYSTQGESRIENAQPLLYLKPGRELALAHNGNLVNAAELRADLEQRKIRGIYGTTDSEVMLMQIAHGEGESWSERIDQAVMTWHGSYSVVMLTLDSLIAFRDPWALRPLCWGWEGDSERNEIEVVASETCALSHIGIKAKNRSIIGGGMISTFDGSDSGGVASPVYSPQFRTPCSFESIYFARPDSILNGQTVLLTRHDAGKRLAYECVTFGDVVVGVPDSGTSAALGYAKASGIPYAEGFIKSRYVGRTFIQPSEELRKLGVALKLSAVPAVVEGQRVIMVDDSIVRGNTAGPLVKLLREAGAREVHVRVASPPIRYPCFLGIDIPTYSELIAHRMSVEQIREHIGADSLYYLSLDGMLAAQGGKRDSRCHGCFSGQYPPGFVPLEEIGA